MHPRTTIFPLPFEVQLRHCRLRQACFSEICEWGEEKWWSLGSFSTVRPSCLDRSAGKLRWAAGECICKDDKVSAALHMAREKLLSSDAFLGKLSFRKIGKKRGHCPLWAIPPPKRVKRGHLLFDYRQKCVNGTRDILMLKARKMTILAILWCQKSLFGPYLAILWCQ